MNIEIIYINKLGEQIRRVCELEIGATAKEALDKSNLLLTYPEVAHLPIGIFSKRISLETTLQPGDRLEIYRPLLIDPKEKRRKRAKE